MRVFIAIFLFLHVLSLSSQTIKGIVTDAETSEPIPFANVFFVGSLIGTTTDLDGNFSLKVADPGKYDLAITFVGYNEYLITIETTESIPFLTVELEPQVIQLTEINVTADTTGWSNNYESFKPLFLGRTINAQKVIIENPKDIFLFYDNETRSLTAHSRKEIKIKNEALGYRINYVMKVFEMNYSQGFFNSYGIPRFEKMIPKNRGQERKWKKRREKTYLGSFQHLLHSIINNSFVEEGFILQELYRIPNPKRPSQKLIDRKISEHSDSIVSFQGISFNASNTYEVDSLSSSQKKAIPLAIKKRIDSLKKTGATPKIRVGEGVKGSSLDSLVYWKRMNRLPRTIDTLGIKHSSNEFLMDENQVLAYTGYLKVVYTKEFEEPNFALSRPGGGIDNKQTSTVLIKAPTKIYENGYYDIGNILFEGYYGWASRMAEMLPLGYKPSKEN